MKRSTLMLVAILVVSTNAYPQSDYEKQTLKGLTKVYVSVGSLPPFAQANNLTSDQIRTDTELRLRRAGISIATRDEWVSMPAVGYLNISVGLMESKDMPELITYSYKVRVLQDVILSRNPNINLSLAETYAISGKFGYIGMNRLRELRESIGDNVDKFINDFLAINSDSSTASPASKDWIVVSEPEEKSKPSQQNGDPFVATYVGGNRPPEVNNQ